MTLGAWIKWREQTGMPCFSIEEARDAFPSRSTNVIVASLSRYRAKGVIQSVHKGFFVVIPPQYALQKRVPDFYYVSQLMAYLQKPYYVSLLSAASLWGASHQAIMVTHLMTELPQSSNGEVIYSEMKRLPGAMLAEVYDGRWTPTDASGDKRQKI